MRWERVTTFTFATSSFALSFVAFLSLTYFAARKFRRESKSLLYAASASIAILKHIAYDAYANAPVASPFPFIVPVSFQNVSLPLSSWILYEVAGASIAIMGWFMAKSN